MIYEINFLVLQSKTEELPAVRKKVKLILEKIPAKIVDQLEYQKRKLAYTIQHQNYGFYTVFRFELDGEETPNALEELKNKLNLENDVARYLIIRADNLPSLRQATAESTEDKTTKEPASPSSRQEKTLTEKKKSTENSEEKIKKEDLAEKIIEEKKKLSAKPEETGASSLSDLDKKLDEILEA